MSYQQRAHTHTHTLCFPHSHFPAFERGPRMPTTCKYGHDEKTASTPRPQQKRETFRITFGNHK